MVLTVLAENSANPDVPALKAAHGLSVHVILDSGTVLYDFGGEDTLVVNSRALGIDLKRVDAAYLSHGHYDHSGSLEAFLHINPGAPVHHGPDAFVPRWSLSRGSPREVGVPPIDPVLAHGRLREVTNLEDRGEYVVLPAAPGFRSRPSGNALLLAGAEGERLQDDFVDELTLVLRGREGLVVLTGCSHRGILNIADQVRAYCPMCPVCALIGGFHMLDSEESDESVRAIGTRLAATLPDAQIRSGHCTESRAHEILAECFPGRYGRLLVGAVMEF